MIASSNDPGFDFEKLTGHVIYSIMIRRSLNRFSWLLLSYSEKFGLLGKNSASCDGNVSPIHAKAGDSGRSMRIRVLAGCLECENWWCVGSCPDADETVKGESQRDNVTTSMIPEPEDFCSGTALSESAHP